MTDGCESMINAIQNEPCIGDASLRAREDEKSSFSNILFYSDNVSFLFPVIKRLTTPAAAALIIKHAETNSTSSAILK
jgi:hypothetical protein